MGVAARTVNLPVPTGSGSLLCVTVLRAALLDSLLCQLGPSGPLASVSTEARTEITSLALQGTRAFERDNYEPGHFTASGFVLSPERTELLLIRHRKLGMWLQPGGHVEPSDLDWVAAARRELEEETGVVEVELLESCFDIDVHAIPAWGELPAHRHHDLRALFVARNRQIELREEVDDVAWFDIEALATSRGPLRGGLGTDDSVRRVAQRLLVR